MQKVALGELNKRYRVSNISKVFEDELGLSVIEIEHLHITQNFIDRYRPEAVVEDCIRVSYDKYNHEYLVFNDKENTETMTWFDFLPYHVCFDCREDIAFAIVLRYMNDIRANAEDLKEGLKEMLRQLCRNELRYKRKI